MYRVFALIALCVVFLSSCTVRQQTLYFKNNTKTDTSVLITDVPPYTQSVVQVDDILAINLTSISNFTEKNPVTIFSDGGLEYPLIPTIGRGGEGGGGGTKGYLVDPEGYIDYPVLGKLKVAGLTLREIKTLLAQRLKSEYVKDPVVEVRIINYKVTILGEVRWPGVVIAPNHRMNVLEAVAAAGDILVTGRKDNVLVIREIDGVRKFAHIDLNSRNAFTNPFFVLKSNDIVIVEAARTTRQSTNDFTNFYVPLIGTVLTGLLSVYAIITLAGK
jgi:polysaccharide export outer membrane protein